MSNDDAIDQFAAGKFAMMVIANSRFEQIQRTAAGWDGKNLGLAPIPGNTADSLGPAIIGGWWAVMSDKSEHKEAAAKFIAYMAGPAAAALWNVPGEQVPTYRSLSSRPEMQEPKRENLRLTADQLSSRGITLPPRCNWARTQADLNLATQQVALGQQSLDDALAQAEQSTNDRQ
jgi:ABC-type glycerol-3-phosphate transport system substrate-binding protein